MRQCGRINRQMTQDKKPNRDPNIHDQLISSQSNSGQTIVLNDWLSVWKRTDLDPSISAYTQKSSCMNQRPIWKDRAIKNLEENTGATLVTWNMLRFGRQNEKSTHYRNKD